MIFGRYLISVIRYMNIKFREHVLLGSLLLRSYV